MRHTPCTRTGVHPGHRLAASCQQPRWAHPAPPRQAGRCPMHGAAPGGPSNPSAVLPAPLPPPPPQLLSPPSQRKRAYEGLLSLRKRARSSDRRAWWGMACTFCSASASESVYNLVRAIVRHYLLALMSQKPKHTYSKCLKQCLPCVVRNTHTHTALRDSNSVRMPCSASTGHIGSTNYHSHDNQCTPVTGSPVCLPTSSLTDSPDYHGELK